MHFIGDPLESTHRGFFEIFASTVYECNMLVQTSNWLLDNNNLINLGLIF